jgi:hypothetical protein
MEALSPHMDTMRKYGDIDNLAKAIDAGDMAAIRTHLAQLNYRDGHTLENVKLPKNVSGARKEKLIKLLQIRRADASKLGPGMHGSAPLADSKVERRKKRRPAFDPRPIPDRKPTKSERRLLRHSKKGRQPTAIQMATGSERAKNLAKEA